MSNKRPPEDMIVSHARRELRLAGAFDKNDEYDGIIGVGVLATIKTLVRYTRGDPAKLQSMVMAFDELVRGNLMSHPTDDPTEWVEMKGADPTMWQNKRSAFFRSLDHGKSWFHIQDKDTTHLSKNHLTGEVPEDEDKPVQENTNDGSDGSSVEESAEATGSDSTGASVQGRGSDPGVVAQSPEDPESPEIETDQPTPRETS